MDLKGSLQAKLILTQALQRSLEILQLPQIELRTLIQEEIEKNPLLEEESYSVGSSALFFDIAQKPSLYEHLDTQIRETFPDLINRKIARAMVQHLDERGFISTPLHEMAFILQISLLKLEQMLSILQTFHPTGIFARTLQECFVLQLRKQKSSSLSIKLVQTAFEDFLSGRYAVLKKKLKASTSDLKQAIQELARLSTRPTEAFKTSSTEPIYPDLEIVKQENGWKVATVESALPKFSMKAEYLELSNLSSGEKETLRTFSTRAKWLIRSIQRRRKLLLSMGAYLVQKQSLFLDQKGPLVLICMDELADELEVHKSTISRALSGKYAKTPLGLISLKTLAPTQPSGSAKELLQELIAQEDKHAPLTDEDLAREMEKRGFKAARRTISKYRKTLFISSAEKRKLI